MTDFIFSFVDFVIYLWNSANEQVFLLFNLGPAADIGSTYFMLAASWIGNEARLGLYAGLLACYLLWRLHKLGTRPAAEYVQQLAVFCIGCALAALCTSLLKDLFHLPRPYVAWPAALNHAAIMPESEAFRSFPSGHAAFAAAVAAGLWPLANPRWRWTLSAFALWVGWSRIALGVHFPIDVAAGYAVGVGVVIATRRALKRLIPIKLRRRK